MGCQKMMHTPCNICARDNDHQPVDSSGFPLGRSSKGSSTDVYIYIYTNMALKANHGDQCRILRYSLKSL